MEYMEYQYKELLNKATAETATKEDRLNLWEWFERHGGMFWNGENYSLGDGKRLFPVWEEDAEFTDCYNVVDCEIR